MHIPTTALLAISFYMLRRSSATPTSQTPSHLFDTEDYEIQCDSRVYSQKIIYNTTKHACETHTTHPLLEYRDFNTAGYRSIYEKDTKGDDKNLLDPSIIVVPIRENGVFHFEMNNTSRLERYPKNETDLGDPGTDRLALSSFCYILGIFTDKNYPNEGEKPDIKWCKVFNKSSREEIPMRSRSRDRMLSPPIDYLDILDNGPRDFLLSLYTYPVQSPEGSYRSHSESQERSQQGPGELSPTSVLDDLSKTIS